MTLSIHWEETENHDFHSTRAFNSGVVWDDVKVFVVGAGKDEAIANVIGHGSIDVARDNYGSARRGIGGSAVLGARRMGRHGTGVRSDEAR